MRPAAVASIILAVVATAGQAPADEPRRGVYAALALGPAFAAGTASYSGSTLPGYGAPRPVSASDGFTGVGPDVRVALGYAPVDGLAIAPELRGFFIALRGARFPYSSLDIFPLWSIGGAVDWYPEPAGPVHVVLGAGYAKSTLMGSGEDIGAADNITVDWHVSGPIVHAAVGYTKRAGATFGYGPLLDVTALRLTSTDARASAACITLALGLSWL